MIGLTGIRQVQSVDLLKSGLFTLLKQTAVLLPGIRVRVRTGDPHAVTHQRAALQVPGLRPWLHNQGLLTLILLACVRAEDPRHVGKFSPTKYNYWTYYFVQSWISSLDYNASSAKSRSKKHQYSV